MPDLEPHRYDADESDSDAESVPDNDEPVPARYNFAINHITVEAREVLLCTDSNLNQPRHRIFGRKQLINLETETDSSDSDSDNSDNDDQPNLVDRREYDSSDNDCDKLYDGDEDVHTGPSYASKGNEKYYTYHVDTDTEEEAG